MGLIKAALGSVGGVLADQWKEYFYCDALDSNTLVVRGLNRTSGRSGNKGSDIARSEERRVEKESRSRWSPYH